MPSAAASAAAAAVSDTSPQDGDADGQVDPTTSESEVVAAEEPADPAAAMASIVAGQTATIETEAQAINDRTTGWTYVLPTWKYSNLAKTMDDLLKAPE